MRGSEFMEKKDIITLSVVNFNVDSKSKQKNRSRIAEFSETAARKGSSLIVFPELSLSGYEIFTNSKISNSEKVGLAETLDGETCIFLSEVAKTNNISIVFGMPERIDNKYYNSAVFIDETGAVNSYRKIHPFGNEKIFFERGEEPLIIDTKWGKMGLCICYDTYQFPELLRYYVAKGCRLILNPTAMVEEVNIQNSRKSFENYYIKSLEYASLCNEVFIASANLTGYDGDLYFGGASAVLGPQITPFAEVDSHIYAGGIEFKQEEVITVTIDLHLAKRRLFVPDTIDGKIDYRPDVYKKLM